MAAGVTEGGVRGDLSFMFDDGGMGRVRGSGRETKEGRAVVEVVEERW